MSLCCVSFPLRLILQPLSALLLALLGVCSTVRSGPSARAELKPTAGTSTSGWVQYDHAGGQVKVTAEVWGLKPNGEHGFHVHDKGE